MNTLHSIRLGVLSACRFSRGIEKFDFEMTLLDEMRQPAVAAHPDRFHGLILKHKRHKFVETEMSPPTPFHRARAGAVQTCSPDEWAAMVHLFLCIILRSLVYYDYSRSEKAILRKLLGSKNTK